MSRDLFSSSARRHCRSSALVITLAVLVLICGLLLLFFDQSTLNRQISFSSAGQYRADRVAHTALDTIVGDLRTEIVAGSTNSINGVTNVVSGITIYVPTTNFTAVPFRVADQGFANLVKQSASSSNFWTGSYYNASVFNPIRSAPNNSTATASANGRSIKINQWNKPGLLGDPGPNAVPQMTNNSPTTGNAYIPPDWVLITRAGAVTNALTLPAVGPGAGTLSDKSAGNANYVVGRYAYTIYDEGGLLDVNVAGYPSSVSGTDFTTKRGLLPQVDLANIPGVNNASALVQWRNAATAASAMTYTNYVFTATNGFSTVAPGDQAFVSRQDLINYAQTNPSQLATSALQYLGTFTRELNAPSYTPPPLGSPSRPPDTGGASYVVGQDDAFNPSLINLRVTSSFTRYSDGTNAQIGEPLIKYRFPLSRLNWIGHTGPNGATSAQIYNSFGLTWSSSITDRWSGATTSGWVYNHGTSPSGDGGGQSILSLSDVAALGREPDFFELLQAGILVGSLGQRAADSCSTVSPLDVNTYYQIVQIGANLVDQYDTDSFPTHISFNGYDFYGVENLPYLVRVFDTPYRFSQPGNYSNIGIWFQPEIWNPNAAEGVLPSAPSNFRFIVSGSAYALFTGSSDPAVSDINNFNNPTGISFSVSTAETFSVPTLLTTAVGATAVGNDTVNDGSNNFIGIWVGTANAPEPDPDSSTNGIYSLAAAVPDPLLNYQLQYLDGNQWITYDVMRNINNYVGCTDDVFPYHFEAYSPRTFMIRSDPRTDRFGPGEAYDSPNYLIHETIRPNAGIGYQAHGNFAAPDWSFPLFEFLLGCLSDNLPSSSTYYADPDSIVRPADGAYTDNNVADGGYPLATDAFNSISSRPIVLNRPFRSVADMGYASRGMPWKHLDFFSAASGDASLLDLFCVDEPFVPASSTASLNPVSEAGRLDLNTRQQPVLTAILTGAIKSDTDGTTITTAEANNLATGLINITTNPAAGPLLSKAELVTRYAPTVAYASVPDNIIKRRRESAIRALSDIGNTRTWNLLIDVVAQSGRYASSAINLNQFTVEGERRYWLHVAIDRYTGKVIQQYIEPIYE